MASRFLEILDGILGDSIADDSVGESGYHTTHSALNCATEKHEKGAFPLDDRKASPQTCTSTLCTR